MSSANRTQIVLVRESTLGTTPTTPRMRTARGTSVDPQYKANFVDSDILRSDRMLNDPIKVMEEADLNFGFEQYFPVDNEPLSEIIRSAMFSAWVNTPTYDNDGTADSVVTDAGTTTDTYVVASGGASVVVGHLVRATGFTNSANNQVFRAASSTGTTIVGSSLSLTAETAPPAAAKLKVVGFAGATADITASSTGLASTLLNFTTLGLAVGMWIKIGGTAAGDKFATAALNSYARITAIAANALTLDNRPTGWTTDAGTGKTIKVWFGDYIKNGTTKTGLSIEVGYLGQDTPTYILAAGQIPNTLEWNITSRQKITGSVAFMGMSGAQSTTPQDASPDTASTAVVMAANANVSRMSEAGAQLVSPNCAREATFSINNNLRKLECVDDDAPIGINEGEFSVTGRANTYFGSNSLYAKFLAGTATAINSIAAKNGQAVIWDAPRVTYRSGSPNVTGKNTDTMLALDWQASIETTYFNCSFIINRLEYLET